MSSHPTLQARRVYFTLPEALHRSQPGARQACYRHFRRSQVWDLAQPVEQLRCAAIFGKHPGCLDCLPLYAVDKAAQLRDVVQAVGQLRWGGLLVV